MMPHHHNCLLLITIPPVTDVHVMLERTEADPGGTIRAIASLKPTKVTLFAKILFNSENNISDIKPVCRPLFCHSSVVKYTSLSQQRSRY